MLSLQLDLLQAKSFKARLFMLPKFEHLLIRKLILWTMKSVLESLLEQPLKVIPLLPSPIIVINQI